MRGHSALGKNLECTHCQPKTADDMWGMGWEWGKSGRKWGIRHVELVRGLAGWGSE